MGTANVDEMSASEAPPEAGTGPDPALPPRTVRMYVLVAWLVASAFLFAATFNSHWTEVFVCARCGSRMIAIDGPVLLPMPRPEIMEVGEDADECDHEWRVPPSIWTVSRFGSLSYGLGILSWLVLTLRTGLSLARPVARRARLVSLVVAAVALALVVGGDIWDLEGMKSTLGEMRGPPNPADLYGLRTHRAGIAWHIAASVVCFGGAAAWFAWMMRLPQPDADLD